MPKPIRRPLDPDRLARTFVLHCPDCGGFARYPGPARREAALRIRAECAEDGIEVMVDPLVCDDCGRAHVIVGVPSGDLASN